MNEDRLEAAYTQADAIIFLAEGIPFIQEGEEFMRSKLDPDTGKYEGNSYNVGDYINQMDYSLKVDHLNVFEKTRELIAFRKACPEFRLATRQEISEQLGNVTFENGNITYTVGDLMVIHSITGTKVDLSGSYEVVYSNLRDTYEKVSGQVSVSTNETLVLRKAK